MTPRTPGEEQRFALDSLLPQEMALEAERLGVEKAGTDALTLFVLAVLAGAFIGLGALLSTTVLAGAEALPFGVARLVSGLAFSLGLILVVVGGAELFTGDNLMVMAWASGRVRLGRMLRAWTIIYAGNLVGGVGTAAMAFIAGQHRFADGAVGRAALATAEAKVALPWLDALMLGVLCNVLVCLAVWLSFSARTTTGKILAVVPPITAFVAAGFEHSVANFYYFAVALIIKGLGAHSFWSAIPTSPDPYGGLDLASAVFNLVPVTAGNILGGAGLVGAVYWFVYLRRR